MSVHAKKAQPAAWFMLLFLVVSFVLAVATMVSKHNKLLDTPATTENLLRGKLALDFEHGFAKEFNGKDGFVSLWASLNYGVLRTGSKGVVTGRDGWLFTEEEFTPTGAKAQQSYTENMATILSVGQQLKENGTALVIVLLPAKARVEAERLYTPLPAEREVQYAETLELLRQHHIPVVNALAVLQRMKAQNALPFMRTDTHWSPQGATAVAVATATLIQQLSIALPPAEFTLEPKTSEPFLGDLEPFVPTGFTQGWLGPHPEPLEKFSVTKAPTETVSLFGDEAVEATLIGTSYSAIDTWNFEGALRVALQADIVNLADPGTGPFTPMMKFLKNDAIAPPKLVIWEIPERFLSVHYDELAEGGE